MNSALVWLSELLFMFEASQEDASAIMLAAR
jgi:hypothetical protein